MIKNTFTRCRGNLGLVAPLGSSKQTMALYSPSFIFINFRILIPWWDYPGSCQNTYKELTCNLRDHGVLVFIGVRGDPKATFVRIPERASSDSAIDFVGILKSFRRGIENEYLVSYHRETSESNS